MANRVVRVPAVQLALLAEPELPVFKATAALLAPPAVTEQTAPKVQEAQLVFTVLLARLVL